MNKLLNNIIKYENCKDIRPVKYLIDVLVKDEKLAISRIKRCLIVMNNFDLIDKEINDNWIQIKQLIKNYIKDEKYGY